MSTSQAFGTQLLGQTEKTLNAILQRELAPTGLTEPEWVALVVAISNAPVGRRDLVDRLAAAVAISDTESQDRVDGLVAKELLRVDDADDLTVTVTAAGRELHDRVRGTVALIIQQMWGDLPASDLEAAGRVLSTVLERAQAELRRGA